MKLRLVSIAAAITALSGVILALCALTGSLGKFVRAVADEWHESKASDNVNEMGGDIAQAARIAWQMLALISWPAWGAFVFVVIVTPLAWHRLITAPREAEKYRVVKELSDRTTGRLEERTKAESNDA